MITSSSFFCICCQLDISQLIFTAVALEAADLADTLSGAGTFTVFAPDNSAFDDLRDELLTKLLDQVLKPQLQDVSIYDLYVIH